MRTKRENFINHFTERIKFDLRSGLPDKGDEELMLKKAESVVVRSCEHLITAIQHSRYVED